MQGPWAANTRLQATELLGTGELTGPEDVDVDAQGRLYAGLEDGRIVRRLPNGNIETLAHTGGRPLGLHFDENGNLIIADAHRGLLLLRPSGALHVLTQSAGGRPIRFADDVVVASDGRIYFSDASVWPYEQHRLDLYEAKPYGRLLRYNPATQKTEVLLDGLYFANGVALSQQEDFILVNETSRYRITRYWLKGPKAGQHDIFLDNLPGFPDGIASDGRGNFWLALVSPRNASLDRAHHHPMFKNWVASLPESIQPKPAHYGLVARLDEQGNVQESLHDPQGQRLFIITSVQPVGNTLYFGSLNNNAIGRLMLPAVFPDAPVAP
ncbi:MAG: SMP-30/gluconolactonase/LRE family protein [Hahellaceae bacterium]|nr:SMP-30/gluconolactonase/LRE family protein [Hahellaceae bacterium]MCP5170091.1 SMP-30/gluconolactonase/LRE family protein [Hahellaceae bacterium]